MNICNRVLVVISLIVLVEICTNSVQAQSQPSSSNDNDNGGSDDYFYDSSLSQTEIDKLRKEKATERAREEAARNQAGKSPSDEEAAPEWFARTKNESSDPMAAFMEQAMKEYMKKMQQDYMEKMKSKKKSDINHAFWSVVTLGVFFGSGIVIGLSIVLIRGSKFNKGSRLSSANGAASASRRSQQNNSVKKSDYVSVPQNEKITI